MCFNASERVCPVSLERSLGAVLLLKIWCGFASSISR